MTTIADVQEGKGAFFTKDDIVDKELILVDDRKLSDQIPSHKGQGDAANTDYYEFNISVDGVVKQIGLTYTNMKDMVKLLPVDVKNIQGCRFKYEGEKGKGKNIKYLWTYLGIAAKGTYQTQQTTIIAPENKPTMADYMKKIVDKLTFAGKVYPDGIPASIFTEVIEAELKAAKITEDGAFNRVLTAMKGEGLIFEPKAGFFKVVV